MRWESDEMYSEVGVEIEVGGSHYLYIAASLWEGGIWDVSMIALPRRYTGTICQVQLEQELWGTREGKPTGPGGTHVLEAILEVWDDFEDRVRNLAVPDDRIVVGAATKNLYRIYKKILCPRGFVPVAGELMKTIKTD